MTWLLTDEFREQVAKMPEDQREPWEKMIEQREEAELRLAEMEIEGDWSKVLALTSSEDRAPVLIRAARQVGDDELRQLVEDYWSCTEAWTGKAELRDPMMSLLRRVAPIRVLAEGEAFPDSRSLTIYRGNLGEWPEAALWTLDRAVATKFAVQPFTPRGMILGMAAPEGSVATVWRGQTSTEHVLGYFNDRDEQEVVVDPGHVRGIVKLVEHEPT